LRGLLCCLFRCLLRGLWRYRATMVVALGLPMNGVRPAKTWLAVDRIIADTSLDTKKRKIRKMKHPELEELPN
jgi:hypothetical protein